MTTSRYTARAEIAERFRIMHLMQGLAILDTYNAYPTERPWPFTATIAAEAVRVAVDLPTAAYWEDQLATDGAPLPADPEWADWAKEQRLALEDMYAAVDHPTLTPPPVDPAYGSWSVPRQAGGE